jgi:hypothetical protein
MCGSHGRHSVRDAWNRREAYPRQASRSRKGDIPHYPTNHSPSKGIFHTIRPITAPRKEYSTPSDQSQPLGRNIPHHPTNHSPSEGIFHTIRPIRAPQKEYSTPFDQSQPLKRNIPHHPTNHSPSPRGLSRKATVRANTPQCRPPL